MREPISKTLRFKVFMRDHFTCQYCGRQPTEVVLEVDHISPASLGGPTTIDNLITACEPCNRGKGATPLEAKEIRPDADLLYLQTQQEIAELHRYQAEKAKLDEAQGQLIEEIQEAFDDILGRGWVPAEPLMRKMLGKYPAPVVYEAVIACADALADMRVPGYSSGDGTAWVRYLWGCARNIYARQEEAGG